MDTWPPMTVALALEDPVEGTLFTVQPVASLNWARAKASSLPGPDVEPVRVPGAASSASTMSWMELKGLDAGTTRTPGSVTRLNSMAKSSRVYFALFADIWAVRWGVYSVPMV